MNDTVQTFNVSIIGNAVIAEYEGIQAYTLEQAMSIAIGRFTEKGVKQGWDTTVVSISTKRVGE